MAAYLFDPSDLLQSTIRLLEPAHCDRRADMLYLKACKTCNDVEIRYASLILYECYYDEYVRGDWFLRNGCSEMSIVLLMMNRRVRSR